MSEKVFHQVLNQNNALHAGVLTMGNGKAISDLQVIKELCGDLEDAFRCFTLDRYWNEEKTRLTVCFTAEQVRVPPQLSILRLFPR